MSEVGLTGCLNKNTKPEVQISIYKTYIYPRLEWLVSLRFNHLRKEVLSGLKGTVLEPGIGHGLNLAHYPPEVQVVIGVDPSAGMKVLLDKTIKSLKVSPEVVHYQTGAERLHDLNDCSVDAVVLFLTLCSVSNPKAVLSEIFRVLKPEGELRFFEHVQAEGKLTRMFFSGIHPVWKLAAAGCHLNRESEQDIRNAGFDITSLRKKGILILGSAKKRNNEAVKPVVRNF